ncbi:MAG: hypothetical protein HYS55_04270 [Candidatus Omnitrophica bacterium]|nr:hypothetical protein [Candidatus Omnitrophota bacterium]
MKFWFCVAVFSVWFLYAVPLWAEPTSAELRLAEQKLAAIETKLNRLKASQTEINQKHAQIFQELDVLRIWIRRYRS